MRRRARGFGIPVVLIMGSLLLAAPGCKKKPSCALLYERFDKCEEDFALKKDKFLKLCKEEKEKNGDLVKEQIACTKFSSCDEFKKCLKEADKKAQAKRLVKRIDRAIKTGKFKDAFSDCKFSKKDLTEELKKKCADLTNKYFADLKAKADKARDAMEKTAWRFCPDLKTVGEELGAAAKKEAKSKCDELNVVGTVKRALDAVKKAAAKPKPTLPFVCGSALKQLTGPEVPKTPWTMKMKDKLLKACYIDQGKKVLGAWLATKPRFCINFAVGEIYKAVKKFGIQDKELLALIEKARPVCKKEFAKEDAQATGKQHRPAGK